MANAMVVTMVGPFQMATRECAMQMMSNAQYVLGELPNVTVSDGLRTKTKEVCETLIGTKHDLITEIFDLDGLLETNPVDEKVIERVERIVRWAHEDVAKLVDVVAALEEEGKRDPQALLASILVMESAGNILKAFNVMRDAAAGVQRAARALS